MKPTLREELARITAERDEVIRTLRHVRDQLCEAEHYYTSAKFTSSPDADYAHVRTDVLPRLAQIRFLTLDN